MSFLLRLGHPRSVDFGDLVEPHGRNRHVIESCVNVIKWVSWSYKLSSHDRRERIAWSRECHAFVFVVWTRVDHVAANQVWLVADACERCAAFRPRALVGSDWTRLVLLLQLTLIKLILAYKTPNYTYIHTYTSFLNIKPLPSSLLLYHSLNISHTHQWREKSVRRGDWRRWDEEEARIKGSKERGKNIHTYIHTYINIHTYIHIIYIYIYILYIHTYYI